MTTWKALLTAKMSENRETYADVIYANAVPTYRHEIWKDASPEELEELKKTFPSTFEKFLPPDVSKGQWDEIEFDDGVGGENGMPFVVYTENWVYFPVCYDGSEWVDAIPRNPNPDWKPKHFGG